MIREFIEYTNTMTELELKTLLDNSLKENVNPIVKQMTDLICNAYEAGVNVGMEVGKVLQSDK